MNYRINEGRNEYLESNSKARTTYRNPRDTVKAVLSEKFLAVESYIRKTE